MAPTSALPMVSPATAPVQASSSGVEITSRPEFDTTMASAADTRNPAVIDPTCDEADSTPAVARAPPPYNFQIGIGFNLGDLINTKAFTAPVTMAQKEAQQEAAPAPPRDTPGASENNPDNMEESNKKNGKAATARKTPAVPAKKAPVAKKMSAANATPKKPAAQKPAHVKAPAAESIAGPSSSKPAQAKKLVLAKNEASMKDEEATINDPEAKSMFQISKDIRKSMKDIPKPTKKVAIPKPKIAVSKRKVATSKTQRSEDNGKGSIAGPSNPAPKKRSADTTMNASGPSKKLKETVQMSIEGFVTKVNGNKGKEDEYEGKGKGKEIAK